MSHNPAAIETLLVDLFLEAHRRAPEQIILDLDATDDPLHGQQEGRFFHGYYDCYCYCYLRLPASRHMIQLETRLNMDGAAGAVEEVAPWQPAAHWPVRSLVGSGFNVGVDDGGRGNTVDFLFDLAPTGVLEEALKAELITATLQSIRTGKPARCFRDFTWSTLDSWSRERRVVGKAEVTGGEANPRFVVTQLKSTEVGGRYLYEKVYCARGEMENRIKECQLDLFADRTSAATMHANQLRLWLASMAYVLLCAVRRIGLAHTQFAQATCGTIRLKLLKIGAQVRVSVRRIKVAMASACPISQ